jgi:hypothetical protein
LNPDLANNNTGEQRPDNWAELKAAQAQRTHEVTKSQAKKKGEIHPATQDLAQPFQRFTPLIQRRLLTV